MIQSNIHIFIQYTKREGGGGEGKDDTYTYRDDEVSNI